MSLPILGITIGDLNGVGPEVVAKTFSDPRMLDLCTPVIFASAKVMNNYKRLGPDYPFQFTNTKDLSDLNPAVVNVFNCWEEEVALQPGALTDAGGKYAIRSLQVAAQCLKDGQLDAIVTAPIHKGNTKTQDFPYTGHTPFFKDFFGAKEVVMLLFSGDLRVGLVTEHIAIKDVASVLTKELLLSKITILRDSLVKDFGIAKPRIAVLGLNPHAGDEGQIGVEEQTVISPVLEQLKAKGELVFGPYSADAFFARRSYLEFDAVLAMYHDQGLVPFKTIAQGEGINYTAGMSVVRTSPDHGTAFDIAGHGVADPHSFREAVFAAIDLLQNRRDHAEGTANPLRRGRTERERPGGGGGSDFRPRNNDRKEQQNRPNPRPQNVPNPRPNPRPANPNPNPNPASIPNPASQDASAGSNAQAEAVTTAPAAEAAPAESQHIPAAAQQQAPSPESPAAVVLPKAEAGEQSALPPTEE